MRENAISIGGLVLLLSIATWANMPELLTLTGRVVDSQAQPVEGAEVAVYENAFDYATGQESASILVRTETDAQGSFAAQALVSDQLMAFVVVRKPGLAMGWDCVNAANHRGALRECQIVLGAPCRIAGVVRDEYGSSVPNARVRIECMSDYLRRLEQREISAPEEWFTTQTDARGRFQFENLAADVRAYFLVEALGWASKHRSSFAHGGMGYEAGREDIQLVLPSEIAVHGRVVDSATGQAIEEVTLVMDSYRDQPWDYVHQPVVSDEDGRFRFAGVPVEKHFIRAAVPFERERPWIDRILVVETSEKTSSEYLVKLDQGGVLDVLVTEASKRRPVEGIKIAVSQRERPGFAGFYKIVQTGRDGKVQIRAPLQECDVSLALHMNDGFVHARQSQKVNVEVGQTKRIGFSLERKPQMSGVVLDESGKPVPGAIVTCYPEGGNALTDDGGKFAVEYEPQDNDRCLLVRHEQRNLVCTVKTADVSRPLQVRLGPGLRVNGRVVDTQGQAICAARISVVVSMPRVLCRLGPEVLTDAQGRYEFTAFPLTEDKFQYRYSVAASGYGRLQYKPVAIAARPGEVCEVDTIALPPADLSISGVVVDGDGKPAANIPMFLRGPAQPQRRGKTAEDGTFVFRRICSGPLRIQANYPSWPGGAGYLKADGSDNAVKIILGQERVHTTERSLIDRDIPSLLSLGVNFGKGEIQDRRLLLCFFDMEQRPSRRVVSHLAKKAKELKEQAFVVVLVQAAEIAKGRLDQWLSENEIPFKGAVLAGDIETTKSEWGVKSLPWLILTDRDHKVTAEGFTIAELVQRLK